MQKSTRNGSQGISVAGVIVGKEVGGNSVLVGMTFVLMTMGVSVTSTLAQEERINNRKRLSSRFIEIRFGVRQLDGGLREPAP
jgi:hypothetical protein